MQLSVPALASLPVVDPAVSADIAQQLLIDGNQRFIQGKLSSHDVGVTRRMQLSYGQNPYAVIVTCSDSRVPPELIFDQGLGYIFVIRVAGNVLDAITLGSVEYAVEHLNTKLVVVMGHEKCGAIKSAVEGAQVPPNIAAIAAKIQPAADMARLSNPADIYEAATDANIANMVSLIKTDPIIAHIPDVKVVGAKYYFASGEVVFDR